MGQNPPVLSGSMPYPLQMLQKFSFSSDLPSFNSLQWSQSNRLIGLNLREKLIIFQMNINFAINESTVNRKQWIEENLKFYVATICPEIGFVFNVGQLDNYELSQRQGYTKHPKKSLAEFKCFNFSPSIARMGYNLIGAITDDFCFLLYLQLKSNQWQLIHNLSTDLNEHYIRNKWNDLQGKIDFTQHCQRLDTVSTTCFCWQPTCLLDDQKVQFHIYSATKSGDICLWDITLSNGENSKANCEAKIVHIAHTTLNEIVTLQLHGCYLLAESSDGRSFLFNAQDRSLTKKVDLWQERDNLPCYNFCFSQLDNNRSELIFHKGSSIIRAQLLANFGDVEYKCQYFLDDDIEVLAMYHYGGPGKYFFTEYNEPKLWEVTLPKDSTHRLKILEIKLVNFSFGRTASVYGFDCSTNRVLMAFVSNNIFFCSKSHVLKNVEIIFCTNTSSDSVCRLLTDRLFSKTSSIHSLLDCLYLFRYYLFREANSESLKRLLHVVLGKSAQLFAKFDQMTVPDHLLFMKTIRYIIRRYWELTLLPEVGMMDTDTHDKVVKILTSLDRCIRRKTTEHILTSRVLASTDGDLGATSLLTCEQLVSLCNINQQSAINNVPKTVIDQAVKAVRSKEKSALNGLRSSFGLNYSSQVNRSKSLLDLLNKCPFCEKTLTKVAPETHCPQHLLDICTNSLLVADPLQNDVDLCAGCLESKLLQPRIWPSPVMSPFYYSYDHCLFCL